MLAMVDWAVAGSVCCSHDLDSSSCAAVEAEVHVLVVQCDDQVDSYLLLDAAVRLASEKHRTLCNALHLRLIDE